MALLPIGSKLHSTANNGNSVTFALPGHTTEKPRLAIFKRVIPEYSKGLWSKPSYDVKVVYGIVDADGNPVPTRVSVGTTGIQWPMQGADVNSSLTSAQGVFAAIVSDPGFPAMVYSQTLPSQADVATV